MKLNFENSYLLNHESKKMQIICQNAQQENVYLLVPLVKLFGQIKLPLFNNYRNGRNEWKFVKSITL